MQSRVCRRSSEGSTMAQSPQVRSDDRAGGFQSGASRDQRRAGHGPAPLQSLPDRAPCRRTVIRDSLPGDFRRGAFIWSAGETKSTAHAASNNGETGFDAVVCACAQPSEASLSPDATNVPRTMVVNLSCITTARTSCALREE